MKAGVIGVGRLGKHHARIYSGLYSVELVGVSDIKEDRGKRIAKIYGTEYFRDTNELLKKVDMVSIVTPTTTHCEIAREVIKMGVHTLVEKPMTSNIEEANEIIKIAAQNNILLQIGHIERFNPAIVAIEPFIKDIVFIDSTRSSSFEPRASDVSVVIDLMVHDIDIALKFVRSEVKSIEASGNALVSGKTDIASARIVFKNGVTANFFCSRVSPNKTRTTKIFQRDSLIIIDYLSHSSEIFSKDGDGFTRKEDVEIVPREPLWAELESFVRSVKNGDSPSVTGQEGLSALHIACQIESQIVGT